MRRAVRLLSGLVLVGLAGAVACYGRESWPYFLGAGVLFLGWSSRS